MRACKPEPRTATHESRTIPTKKSKNGHNALIWYYHTRGAPLCQTRARPFFSAPWPNRPVRGQWEYRRKMERQAFSDETETVHFFMRQGELVGFEKHHLKIA